MPDPGGGTAPGRRFSSDGWSGVFFALVGTLGLALVRAGQGSAIAGTSRLYPAGIAIGLLGVGLFLGVRACFERDHRGTTRLCLRPIAATTGSVLVFALSIARFGFIPAVIGSVLVAASGSSEARLRPTVLLAAGLATALALLFVGLLGQPLELGLGF